MCVYIYAAAWIGDEDRSGRICIYVYVKYKYTYKYIYVYINIYIHVYIVISLYMYMYTCTLPRRWAVKVNQVCAWLTFKGR